MSTTPLLGEELASFHFRREKSLPEQLLGLCISFSRAAMYELCV